MKAFKSFAMVAVVAVLVFSLAACSSGKKNNDSSPSAPAASPSASELAETSPASPSASEATLDMKGATIKLVSTSVIDPAKVENKTELTDLKLARQKEVEAKYNVKIEYVQVPWGELKDKVVATALSGDPVGDLILSDLRWVPTYVAGGMIKPLSEVTDLSDPMFNESIRKLGTFNGVQYGFSDMVQDGAGIYYNRTMIQREGLEDPHELARNGQWTWDKFMEMMKKVTKDTNGDGKMDQYGFAAYAPTFAYYIMMSNGGYTLDQSGKEGLSNPNSVEALEFMNKMYNVDKVVLPAEGDPEAQAREQFQAGKVLFVSDSTWVGLLYQKPENMADDYGYIYMPKGPKAEDLINPLYDAVMWYVPTGAKHPTESIQIWKELQIWDRLDQGFDDFMDLAFRHDDDKAVGKDLANRIVPEYGIGIPDLNGVFEKVVGTITKGEKPPATAVEENKAQAQALIDALFKK